PNMVEKNLAIKRQYYADNKEKLDEISRVYAKEHPENMRAAWRKYRSKRMSTPKGKLNNSISARVNHSLGKGVKAGRAWEELVGFTVDQLKKHLEKRFKPGMTWDNYGTYWSIDHKVPVAVHNFEHPDDIDFRLCWSLKNLQPLEVKINSRKKDKLEKPFQPALALRVA
ncbi:MAG: HNH endonuclease, partial [Pseudomonadota bacterium]